MEDSSFTLPSPTAENMDTEVLVKVEEDNLQSAPSDLGADVIEVSVYSCGFDPSSYVIDQSSCFDKLKSYQSVNVKCLIFLSQLLKMLLKRNQTASTTWLNLKMALGSIKRTGNGFFTRLLSTDGHTNMIYNIARVLALDKSYWAAMNKIFIYGNHLLRSKENRSNNSI